MIRKIPDNVDFGPKEWKQEHIDCSDEWKQFYDG